MALHKLDMFRIVATLATNFGPLTICFCSVFEVVGFPHVAEKRPHELVGVIYKAFDDPVQAKGIVETLVTTGAVGKLSIEQSRCCHSEGCVRHIVERLDTQGTTNVYVVTPSYREALERLRS
jgi:hypothetical protein